MVNSVMCILKVSNKSDSYSDFLLSVVFSRLSSF